MRRVFLATHSDSRDRTDHRDRRHHDRVLSDRSVNGPDVLPAALVLRYIGHPGFWRLRDLFVRKIDARSLVELERIDHLEYPVDAHFKTKMIVVAVAGFCDGVIERRRAMAAHATGELIADLYSAA